jgi:hypothetical protein
MADFMFKMYFSFVKHVNAVLYSRRKIIERGLPVPTRLGWLRPKLAPARHIHWYYELPHPLFLPTRIYLDSHC